MCAGQVCVPSRGGLRHTGLLYSLLYGRWRWGNGRCHLPGTVTRSGKTPTLARPALRLTLVQVLNILDTTWQALTGRRRDWMSSPCTQR